MIVRVVAAWAWLSAASVGQAQVPAPSPPSAPAPVDPHAGHRVPAPAGEPATPVSPDPDGAPLPPFIPPVSAADRAAAFPDVMGHSVHDTATHAFVLADQLEWLRSGSASAFSWDAKGWVGGDRSRLWFRSEGDRAGGAFEQGEAQLFYGRPLGPWWDLLVGIRQDLPGPARTWAAIGVQGLAPQWLEVEATAYLGESGRTHLRLETAYELLITNRLVAQPLVEVQVYGKDDVAHARGAGLGSAEIGLRLRYELRRRFAPYLGISWDRAFFQTADLVRASGRPVARTRLTLGLRAWQ